MRLVLFVNAGASLDAHRIGALHPDGVHVADVSSLLQDERGVAFSSMRKFLELGEAGAAAAGRALAGPVYLRKLTDVVMRAPIYDPCVLGWGGARGGSV